jgi:hypothetical protein
MHQRMEQLHVSDPTFARTVKFHGKWPFTRVLGFQVTPEPLRATQRPRTGRVEPLTSVLPREATLSFTHTPHPEPRASRPHSASLWLAASPRAADAVWDAPTCRRIQVVGQFFVLPAWALPVPVSGYTQYGLHRQISSGQSRIYCRAKAVLLPSLAGQHHCLPFALQEMASSVFSVAILLAHVHGLRHLRAACRQLKPPYAYLPLLTAHAVLNVNGWVWSAVFHAR